MILYCTSEGYHLWVSDNGYFENGCAMPILSNRIFANDCDLTVLVDATESNRRPIVKRALSNGKYTIGVKLQQMEETHTMLCDRMLLNAPLAELAGR